MIVYECVLRGGIKGGEKAQDSDNIPKDELANYRNYRHSLIVWQGMLVPKELQSKQTKKHLFLLV